MNEPERITSRENQHVKFARRVRDGKERQFILIEGIRLCEEALDSAIGITSVFVSEPRSDLLSTPQLRRLFESKQTNVFAVSESLLASISDTKTPQGMVMIGERPGEFAFDGVFLTAEAKLPIWVFLYRVNNPANLGAVIRTAEAAGINGVLTSTGSADAYSAKALRASMGSAFRLPVIGNLDPAECILKAREAGYSIVSTMANGTVAHTELDWKRPTLLVFGSEAFGLPEEFPAEVDAGIKIEMAPSVESLNLAVSAGVILFEARRQNGSN